MYGVGTYLPPKAVASIDQGYTDLSVPSCNMGGESRLGLRDPFQIPTTLVVERRGRTKPRSLVPGSWAGGQHPSLVTWSCSEECVCACV